MRGITSDRISLTKVPQCDFWQDLTISSTCHTRQKPWGVSLVVIYIYILYIYICHYVRCTHTHTHVRVYEGDDRGI
jgi:hypothetical protein